MTNGEKLMREDADLVALCISEHPQACGYCAYRGECDECQPYYERTCREGVLEWLCMEAG